MRQLIAAAAKISALGYQDTDDADSTLREAENILAGVRGSGTAADGFRLLRSFLDRYLEADDHAAPAYGSEGATMTGYRQLDALLGGIRREEFVVIGARPSAGKSTLATNIAVNAAQMGHSTAVVSLEMTGELLAHRILCAHADVDSNILEMGFLSADREQRIIHSIGELSGLPIAIADNNYLTIPQIRSMARRYAVQHGLDLLVIDYLQLMQPSGGQRRTNAANRTQEITEISRGLKVLARDLNVGLVVCSQLNRQVESRIGHRPLLSDLRDSGSIEQDADVVMFIHREEMYTTENEWRQLHGNKDYPRNLAEIIVAKNRQGPIGVAPLCFIPEKMRFDGLEG